jgi:hypothetical protein
MKSKRSALPLPRYTLRKPGKHGWSYYFNVPSWARAAGCPLHNEALGSDYAAAVQRAELLLLPVFDSWRSGDVEAKAAPGAAYGTLDWLFAEFRSDRRFTDLDPMTRRNHEASFRLVGSHILKDARRLGQVRLVSIDTAVVDVLYQKLLVVKEIDVAGNVIERERRTMLNKAMSSCRRAWNVAARRNPGKVPVVNPFARMGLKSSDRETPTAAYAELQAFRAKAIEMGLPSLATAALIGWEWLQRERDIFATFDVAHYRPKERPNAVRVLHVKTDEENWIPLFDDVGVPLYPELMAELDALKKDRIGGLMLRRDWGNRTPWPTTGSGDLALMSHKTKEIIRAAGLRDELTFTSFRHGGFTEAADADLSDAEMRAAGRHKSAKVLPRYAKRTMKQVEAGAKKRRTMRTKADNLSE